MRIHNADAKQVVAENIFEIVALVLFAVLTLVTYAIAGGVS